MSRLAFYTGSISPFNLNQLIVNIGEALSGQFTLDLVSTAPEQFDGVEPYFDVYDYEMPASEFGGALALRTYLQNHSPDVLTQLIHWPVQGSIVSTLGRRYGVTTVCRAAENTFHEYKTVKPSWRPIIFGLKNVGGRIPIHLGHHYLALGPIGRGELISRGVDRNRVTIIPPAVNPRRFQNAPDVDLNLKGRHGVLFLGRLSRMKGIHTVESALPKILERRQDLQFVFVGEAVESLDIPDQFADHVTIVGPVSPSEVPAYLKAASVLIHPSLTDAVPRAILEALHAGTPVIARSVGDIPSVTENTFTTESGFVNMVLNFESLELDPIDPYELATVKQQYKNYYTTLLSDQP